MKVNRTAVESLSPVTFSPGELDAVERVIEAGELYGFGNMMSWLQTAWVKKVPEMKGGRTVTEYPLQWLKK
jgi:hypothetical protein